MHFTALPQTPADQVEDECGDIGKPSNYNDFENGTTPALPDAVRATRPVGWA
jgi:hypothetical protein